MEQSIKELEYLMITRWRPGVGCVFGCWYLAFIYQLYFINSLRIVMIQVRQNHQEQIIYTYLYLLIYIYLYLQSYGRK